MSNERKGPVRRCLELGLLVGGRARVRFSENFKTWFLSGQDAIEEPVTRPRLCSLLINYSAELGTIIDLAGGYERYELDLEDVVELVEKQGGGKGGDTLDRHCPNILCIRDGNNVLCWVWVSWNDGWSIDAYPIAERITWQDDVRVFFPSSRG